MDEPTIGQDYLQKDRLRNFIVQLVSQGKTIVIVTHDVEFVAECKPRVVLLSKGKVIADGPAASILTDPSVVEQGSLAMPQISTLMASLTDFGARPDMMDAYSARDFLTGKLRARTQTKSSA